MEEWEDELQIKITALLDEYLLKGFTTRQCIGVLRTLEHELIPTIHFEPEE